MERLFHFSLQDCLQLYSPTWRPSVLRYASKSPRSIIIVVVIIIIIAPPHVFNLQTHGGRIGGVALKQQMLSA